MRTIIFLRHGQAESSSSTGQDDDRALTALGRRQAAAVGVGLARWMPTFDALWVSPYRRAQETAQLAIEKLTILQTQQDAELTPSGDPESVAERLFLSRARSILVVSHLPLIPSVTSILMGNVPLEVAPATAVKLLVVGGQGAPHSCVLSALIPADVFLSTAHSPR